MPKPPKRNSKKRKPLGTAHPSFPWKVGNWVVYDLDVGQIKEIRGETSVAFSNGFTETSGNLADRFRVLTLRSKRIAETFDVYYKRLKDIDGNAGFNYPDIHAYFSDLARQAIDQDDDEPFRKAQEFVQSARDYTPRIDGIRLFRPR